VPPSFRSAFLRGKTVAESSETAVSFALRRRAEARRQSGSSAPQN
jgi:hypothetical protein